VALKPPFKAGNQLALANKIVEGQLDRIPMRYSEEMWQALKLMLTTDPNKRFNCQELLKLKPNELRLKERNLRELGKFLITREEKFYKVMKEHKRREDDV
jgi:hypothetical protein